MLSPGGHVRGDTLSIPVPWRIVLTSLWAISYDSHPPSGQVLVVPRLRGANWAGMPLSFLFESRCDGEQI